MSLLRGLSRRLTARCPHSLETLNAWSAAEKSIPQIRCSGTAAVSQVLERIFSSLKRKMICVNVTSCSQLPAVFAILIVNKEAYCYESGCGTFIEIIL